MLDGHDKSLALTFADERNQQLGGQHRVCADVLIDAAEIRAAVHVCARTVDAGHIDIERFLAPHFPLFCGKLLVECGAEHRFGGVGDAGKVRRQRDRLVRQRVGKRIAFLHGRLFTGRRVNLFELVRAAHADRTVVRRAFREGQRRSGFDGIVAVGDHVAEFIDRQPVEHLLPRRIVVIEVAQGDDVFCAERGERVGGFILRRKVHILDFACIPARPRVVAVAGIVALGVVEDGEHILRSGQFRRFRVRSLPVGTGHVGDRAGDPCIDVRLRKRARDRFAGVEALGVGLGVGLILLPCIGQRGVAAALALGGKDVVDRFMRAVADRKVVIARIHDVGLCVDIIERREPLEMHGHVERFARAGFEHAGLCKAHELHGRLFDKVLPVVIGVGRLGIDLDDLFTRNRAGVGDFDGHGRGMRSVVKGNVCELPVERGVAHAEAERPHDLVVIVPRTGIALSEDGIFVAGLVIAVIDVDALGVDDIVFRLRRLDLRAVRVGEVAEVLRGRDVIDARHIGIDKLSGRADLAGDHVRNAERAAEACVAEFQNRVDIRIVCDLPRFDQMIAGEQHDDLAAAGFGGFDRRAVGIAQRKRAFRRVVAFAIHPSEDRQRDVAAGILYGETVRFERLGHARGGREHGGRHGGAAVARRIDKVVLAEHADRAGGQRQHAVIFQKHGALVGNIAQQLRFGVVHLLQIRVIRGIIHRRAVAADDPARDDAEKIVDPRCELQGKILPDQRNDEEEDRDQRKRFPKILSHSVPSFPL